MLQEQKIQRFSRDRKNFQNTSNENEVQDHKMMWLKISLYKALWEQKNSKVFCQYLITFFDKEKIICSETYTEFFT